MSLIPKFFNDRLDLSIALTDHLFSDFALCFNVLVLSALEHIRFKLVLLNQQPFSELFEL